MMDTLLKGLSASEAEQLAAAGKANVVPNTGQKTTWQIIRDNIFTYFNLIFAVLAGLLIATGNFRNLTFLPVVIANMLIGIVQQLRSKKVLDELTVLSAAKCAVLRDGKVIEVPVDTLVLGDVIFLDEGKQIPADAEVLEGTVSVNESLLTGESDEIEKKPGAELMSGSFTVAGRCYARLTKVGADSYAAGLTAEAKSIETGQSEMVRGIDTIVKVAGILIIPIGVLLMLQGVFANGLSIARSVEAMVGAVIGMIPEGLYLLVTVALALSAARLATKKVLLHDMKSTETLARVD
ncbi:MAG: HAD-IC family P-type ATPase, partial [Eubacteriaceae bacterium]|nr:HAD-IC family P-type ATPase [Eubacteriaceae bacterium]